MTAPLLAEWRQELQRRLARARALVCLGLPDPGFELLAVEIYRFKARLGRVRAADTADWRQTA
jgi:hypothetical protein